MAISKINVDGVEYDLNDARFDPEAATEEMTQDVGITADGKLKTKPSEGGGGSGLSFSSSANGWIPVIPKSAAESTLDFAGIFSSKANEYTEA